ncbi:hypothetical protein P175DRAFT_0177250 [Aspergillus ochraceoroseus IBT 24754]|uniref:Cation efflux protein cytoplasmic domain-containing protein n=1 Tax=Aspergillus ochraceoroseus IBT 24754 TaxID=1392256 RepID=A0A2T5M4U9_9EURO|nr:uncharacterized protein P175DRAFT_0177250 [Aspergillus ochraceoroseus IBT 24754]PTU23552.1 hypothetical protein P175DRAFT_0177250 [Aspergillus ochraceoroseus IBT 24754]
MVLHITREHRLMLVISISASFFLAEISVGFYTHSLALVADAFHYLNDLIGFLVAFTALKISQRSKHPKELSFGWQRAPLLGAFFNGVFLLSLGISIFLQSIDRFISLQKLENPKLVLIIGCVGLGLNIVSGVFLHEHDHGHGTEAADHGEEISARSESLSLAACSHTEHRHNVKPQSNKTGHDLGMMGVLVHVIGDAINNIGVIIAAVVIWKADYEGRYYADPAVSMGISFVILLSSLPLVRKTGAILLQSVPLGLDPEDVKHDLEAIPGVESVHELHIWRLNQQKALASAHLVVSDDLVGDFMQTAKIINECFHAYGIHSTTLQPEYADSAPSSGVTSIDVVDVNATIPTNMHQVKHRHVALSETETPRKTVSRCLVNCRSSCEWYACCSSSG